MMYYFNSDKTPYKLQAALVIRGGYVPRIARKYQNRE